MIQCGFILTPLILIKNRHIQKNSSTLLLLTISTFHLDRIRFTWNNLLENMDETKSVTTDKTEDITIEESNVRSTIHDNANNSKRKQETDGNLFATKRAPVDSIDINPIDYQKRRHVKPSQLTDEEKELIASVTTSCVDVDKIEKAIALRLKARLSLRMPDDLNDTSYYIENGLRKVYPYTYMYQCYTKRRWLGKRLSDVIRQEFRALTPEQILRRFELKYHLVNGKPADLDYKLNDNDFVCNIAHRHELPVLATPIKIIHQDNNLVVIDKPPSMPIHPCGRYRHNSILTIMKKDYNYTDLYVVHRLDRLVSGVLILARNSQQASIMEKQIADRDVEKEYVCRVEGEFPEGEVIVEKGLMTLSRKVGITIVNDEKGKPSKTIFKRLSYNGISSAVLCKPLTGRMHQIRVHLQYLGYPIVNDGLYNSESFGKAKGKHGVYDKNLEQLLEDIITEHRESAWIIPDEFTSTNETDISNINTESHKHRGPVESEADKKVMMKALCHYFTDSSWQELQERWKLDSTKLHKDPNCFECDINFYDPPLSMLFLYLHALSYKVMTPLI